MQYNVYKNGDQNQNADDFFDWFSKVQLPALEEANIQALLGEEKYSRDRLLIVTCGIDSFTQAFPRLRSFSIKGADIPPFVFREFLFSWFLSLRSSLWNLVEISNKDILFQICLEHNAKKVLQL